MTFEEILEIPPYSLGKEQKKKLLDERLSELCRLHFDKCELYKRMLEGSGGSIDGTMSYDDIPFLPVRLFKELELKSVPEDEVFKTMTSSGTTGQSVSRI